MYRNAKDERAICKIVINRLKSGTVLQFSSKMELTLPKWLDRDKVAEAIANSVSVRQAMIKLGYKRTACGSQTHLTKRIREWGIDTSHLLGCRANSGPNKKGGPKKKSANEILIYHADGQRNRVAQLRRALDEIGRPYCCSSCGLKNWQGKVIVLEVDHRDGDFQNDRSDNLEYLCPNCHSQTETYCGKKRGAVVELEDTLLLESSASA